jgi:hypothetical protein
MSYQSGTATGPTDLLDKIRAFLLADSWTINDHSADGAGYRLHVQKTASDSTVMYFNFRSAINENVFGDSTGYLLTGIGINGSIGYDAGEAWNAQPTYSMNRNYTNATSGCVISNMSTSAIPSYFFFTIGDSVHIVVEVVSGEYQYMSFGCLAKQGVFTGGQYFSANYPSYGTNTMRTSYGPTYFSSPMYSGASTYYMHGFVYVDVDSVANWRMAASYASAPGPEIVFPACCPSISSSYYYWSETGLASMFAGKSPNFYNNIAAMCPLYTSLKRSDNNYSLLGCPDGIRFINTTNYSIGQEITYGSETWKIFRTGLHNGSIPTYHTNFGFAFKKVV